MCIIGGTCSTDSGFFSFEDTKQLGQCALKAMDENLGAHFLWTAHNEIEAKWDYVRAWDLGWINRTEVANPLAPETMFEVNQAHKFEPKQEGLFLE